ncbi:MAG: hypothetical protein E7218_03350 [Anaerofustis stercorihominis]|nr:hypothetical protein [Anaerofustis stercorihominis]
MYASKSNAVSTTASLCASVIPGIGRYTPTKSSCGCNPINVDHDTADTVVPLVARTTEFPLDEDAYLINPA